MGTWGPGNFENDTAAAIALLFDPGCHGRGPLLRNIRPFMRIALLLAFFVVLTGCTTRHTELVAEPTAHQTSDSTVPIAIAPANKATQPDPIGALVTRLSSTHGLWINGISPKIDLPSTASTQQVLERVFQMTGFDKGHVTTFRIIETREVRIAGGFPEPYTAVLVETDLGRKVVLFRSSSSSLGWWSRVYDA